MPLKLDTSFTLTEMARVVTDFLPATFNNTTSFPIAAQNAGVHHHWRYEGGKRGSVARMFKATYAEDPKRLLAVVKQIVDLGLVYRGRADKEPIYREEIVRLNDLLRDLNLRIRSLSEASFLEKLPSENLQPNKASPPNTKTQTQRSIRETNVVEKSVLASLKLELMNLTSNEPDAQRRGYRFESFLNQLFAAHSMAPRKPFRNKGEQIDGSFVHRNDTFLLEAKWQAKDIAVRELYHFASKVETKAAWGRGLFISQSGFTDDGLVAFRQGKPTSIV